MSDKKALRPFARLGRSRRSARFSYAPNGRTESWVANRTGHKSSKMINEYRRQAECHRELLMGGLAPLVEAIPELAAVRANLEKGADAAAE